MERVYISLYFTKKICYLATKESYLLPRHPNYGTLIERVNGDETALRKLIIEIVRRHDGSFKAAADELKVQPNTLYYWRDKLKITKVVR